MLNPRLAGRYAKSLVDLAIEKDQLDAVYNDMMVLDKAMKENRELVVLMKSPVVASDKKLGVMSAVMNGRVSEMTAGFIRLLISKTREGILPEIIQAFIEQFKVKRDIQVVTLTTASPVSEELANEIKEKVRTGNNMPNIELITEVDPSLIGGFVLEVGNSLVDASISYDLKAIKKQFMNNDFIYKIR